MSPKSIKKIFNRTIADLSSRLHLRSPFYCEWVFIALLATPDVIERNIRVEQVRATARIVHSVVASDTEWKHLPQAKRREYFEVSPSGVKIIVRVRDFE